MKGWTTESPGAAQEPQEAPAAESDTTFRRSFVEGAYQALEGDTGAECLYLVPQPAWAQFLDPSLPPQPPATRGVAESPYDFRTWQLVASYLLARTSPTASYYFLNSLRPTAVLGGVVPYFLPDRGGSSEAGPNPSQEELEHHVTGIFEAARDEHFEDGMESSISRTLVPLVEQYHTELAEFLFYCLVPGRVSPQVTAESLRWLGDMDHAPSQNWRRRLLERCLEAPSVAVRDAAGIGLASMDDPQAIPSVKGAITREPCAELRECLQQVLAQLERNPGWRCF